MQTVLIADRSEQFCEVLADRLKDCFLVQTCCSGLEVLEQFRLSAPQVLVLDLELPELDGLSILHTLRSAGHHIPIVAMTTCIQSTYILQTLANFGVEYILPKPCAVSAVVSNIYEILRCQRNMPVQLDDEINTLLLSMGVRTNLGGYACLVEAIRVFSRDTTQQITKTVYPEVAKLCGGTAKRVERAIRSTIQDAWKRRNDSIWSIYFAAERYTRHAPTNGYFIARMVMCLENRKIG